MRTRNRGVLIGTAVVVVLAIFAFTAFVTPGFARSEPTKNIGPGVSVTGSNLPKGLKAQPADAAIPLKGYTTLMPKPIAITPPGGLKSSVTLHFKLDHPVDKNMQPYVNVATCDNHCENRDNWSYLTPTFSKDGQTLSVQTKHFSLWWPLQMALDWTQNFGHEIVDALSGGLTEEAKQPDCKNESAVSDDGYQAFPSLKNSKDKGTLLHCMGVEKVNGKSQTVLKVVNPKHYPLDLEWSGTGLTLVHGGPGLLALKELSKLMAGKDHLILFPTEEAEFTVSVSKGKSARLDTSYSLSSGQAVTLDGLEAALNALSSVILKFGAGKALTQTQKYAAMEHALQGKECYNAVVSRNLGGLYTNCIQAFDIFLGPKAIVLGVLAAAGGLVNYFVSGLSGNVESITGAANYTLTVKRFDGRPVTFHNLTLYLPQGWHFRYGSDEDSNGWHTDQLGIAADCVPQSFWYSPCPTMWFIGPDGLTHYGDGTETYDPTYPYYPATDIRGCRGVPVLPTPTLWRGKNTLLTSSSRPVGSHTAAYHEWRYQCGTLPTSGGGDFKPIAGKSFVQHAWDLPQSHILIVTEYDASQFSPILATARWN